ncbi:MAG: DUF3825 domain-containing protein [Chlorobaculum sp.]|jgi:hypothetical protein|nr:DUF3825 domain-containing protein [Chlorobaculum sp.]
MFAQEELLAQLGDGYTNKVVERLRNFAYLPTGIVHQLAKDALTEEWGINEYALEKYLAVHIPWSIEQGKFTNSYNQFYVTAGHLQTRYGTPLYLVFGQNNQGEPPWRLIKAGSNIKAPELPVSPDIPEPPTIPMGKEIVMMHDHILGDNAERVPFLSNTPLVAQMCAVSGAIQWSLNRNLQLSYWYYGKMQYLVPLYLENRENIALAPDAVAPIQINPNSLLVRTVLSPDMPYANARVAVHRHDQLPPWLLDAWKRIAQQTTNEQIEDPEEQ